MDPKEISRIATRTFLSRLMPTWAAREQEDQEDYGVDFELEPTGKDNRASGILFKAQVKGIESPVFDDQGRLKFSRADVVRFRYYAEALPLPLLLVICDVRTGTCYWIAVQGNREVESPLAQAVQNGQATFTLRIPTQNILEPTSPCADAVLQAVEEAYEAITIRRLNGVRIGAIRRLGGTYADREDTANRFRLMGALAENSIVEDMAEGGDLDKAYARAKARFESKSESPEGRLLSGFSLTHIYAKLRLATGTPRAVMDCATNKCSVAMAMLPISRSDVFRTETRRFVRVFARAARMNVIGQQAFALALSERAIEQQGGAMAGPVVRIQRLQLSACVERDFVRLVRAINFLGSRDLFVPMPYALAEVAEGLLPYVVSLRLARANNVAQAYVNVLFDLLPFCLSVAKRLNDPRESATVIMSIGARMLVLLESAEVPNYFSQFEQALTASPRLEQEVEAELLTRLRAMLEEGAAAARMDEEPSEEEINRFYAQHAAVLGVNLDDPDDESASVIRIGLADRDPTRVAKNCQHIHVLVEGYGILGEMLGLPSAGRKSVVCLKHGHRVGAMRLDDAYRWFSEPRPEAPDCVCCESCADKLPHPEGWRWTKECSEAQDKRLNERRAQ